MPAPSIESVRYCIISPSSGNLTVQITANNGLRVGATFWLFDKNSSGAWVERGSFKLITGDEGKSTIVMDFPPDSLERTALTYRIRACSMIPAVDNGNIEIQIIQDNVNCQITKPMQWSLNELGQCSEGKGKKIESSLYFLFR